MHATFQINTLHIITPFDNLKSKTLVLLYYSHILFILFSMEMKVKSEMLVI